MLPFEPDAQYLPSNAIVRFILQIEINDDIDTSLEVDRAKVLSLFGVFVDSWMRKVSKSQANHAKKLASDELLLQKMGKVANLLPISIEMPSK